MVGHLLSALVVLGAVQDTGCLNYGPATKEYSWEEGLSKATHRSREETGSEGQNSQKVTKASNQQLLISNSYLNQQLQGLPWWRSG